mgnify:CR=1 FL=1
MNTFIDPSRVVAQMGLEPGNVVADFGCGSGYYSLAAAQIVGQTGLIHAIDVQESKLAVTQSIAKQKSISNIVVHQINLELPLKELEPACCDGVILASILHETKNPQALIKNCYLVLKTGGRLLAVDWKKTMTPIGPAMSSRMDEYQLEKMLVLAGFRKDQTLDGDSSHYAFVFIK